MAQVFRPNAPVSSWQDPFERFCSEVKRELGSDVNEDSLLPMFLGGATVAEAVKELRESF
jgi:hypothetical protein